METKSDRKGLIGYSNHIGQLMAHKENYNVFAYVPDVAYSAM